jgi:ABC-type proline/glycine betaine transport system ATPase subunit
MAREGRGRAAAAEIVFDHVSHRYPGRSGYAVHDLSLTIPAGEICVPIGPSGGGKTTALSMVNRLIPITEGDISIDGRSVRTAVTTAAAARKRAGQPALRMRMAPAAGVKSVS